MSTHTYHLENEWDHMSFEGFVRSMSRSPIRCSLDPICRAVPRGKSMAGQYYSSLALPILPSCRFRLQLSSVMSSSGVWGLVRLISQIDHRRDASLI